MDPTMTLESMNTTQGFKDPNSRALGPKSHADYGIWTVFESLDP